MVAIRVPDPAAVPVFGERTEGVEYVVRPSAYVLVGDGDGRLAVVRTPRGWFLPGGGVEAGETEAAAAVREAREECGMAVRPVSLVARAVQRVYSPSEATHFEKPSAFFAGELDALHPAPPSEADHALEWLPPADAARLLSHESQRWAVRRWREGAG